MAINVKRLLHKKGWTGRELGIIEVENMCILFRQALEGKPPQPLVEQSELRRMLSTITDRQQGMTYNGYISIHEWLTVKYNIAQTNFQQAQLQYKTIEGYIERATLAEDVYRYMEQLPAIVTQKQYEELKAERVEAYFKDSQGEELKSGVFDLVEKATSYYVRQLQREPSKPNPLKAIRKKYIAQPVKSDLIRSRWNEVTGEGYYTIEDGSGRRSDQMTAEEWQDAITTPAMAKAIREMKATDGRGEEYTSRIAMQRLLDRSKVIYNGGTEEDADRLQREKDYREGLATPVKWHYYEEPPADLCKWDVLEQELLYEFYPADLDGSGEPYGDNNFLRSMEDFTTEYAELVKVILADIDKKFFKGERGLSDLPLEEWGTTTFSWRQLYEKDFYTMREDAEDDTNVFSGNYRAILNGVATVRPSTTVEKSLRIDADGNYVEPELKQSLSQFTLEAFFPESEDYAENLEIIENARETLVESYYFVKGYNLALELVAKHFDLPDFTVFQLDIATLEEQIAALNDLVPFLYRRIKDTHYPDEELKAKKLQVLKDLFQELDYNAIQIPAENVEQAVALFKDFKAFRGETGEEFYKLMFILPPERDELDYYEEYEGDEDGEDADEDERGRD